jgi:hypothetical protein
LYVFDQLSLKTSNLPNTKGTFDVNLVFTATLTCTKRALFITKKGTFCPLKKLGEGGHVPPGSYAPEDNVLRIYTISKPENKFTTMSDKVSGPK